ncbi:hypothetical protein KY330_05550 [Candidatus Woesearchaeota archaeon]|nr:hypothetical protein [Candidatus Woesearchaeota archaeon]
MIKFYLDRFSEYPIRTEDGYADIDNDAKRRADILLDFLLTYRIGELDCFHISVDLSFS